MITIPTIATIRDQIIADIESKIGQTVPVLPKAFFRVLATALAGVLALLYRFGAWIYRQIFVATADAEALALRGAEFGVPDEVLDRDRLGGERRGRDGQQQRHRRGQEE